MANANSAGQIGIDLVLNGTKSFSNTLTKTVGDAFRNLRPDRTISNSFAKIGKIAAAAFSTGMIVSFSKACINAAQAQVVAETKLATIMKQRMNATNEAINSFKEYAALIQEQGVIGDEVVIAGAQQLSTFLKQESALRTLTPVMADLIAQQNGLIATEGDAVNIGNMLGKAMQGQTGVLQRAGVTFSEAQEKVMKYGNEEERAAMLAQVITENVGHMNEALRKTPFGAIKALKNDFGDLKEVLGKLLVKFIQPLVVLLDRAVIFATKLAKALAAAFGIDLSFSDDMAGASGGMNDLVDATDEESKSLKKATKSLMGFDAINKLSDNSSSSGGGVGGDFAAAAGSLFDMGDIGKGLDGLNEKMQAFIDKLKKAYEIGGTKGVFQFLGYQISSLLNKTPWDKIQEKVSAFAKGFADAINGLASSSLPASLGKWLAGLATTAYTGIRDFIDQFDSKKVGMAISNFINSFIDNFDFTEAGKTFIKFKMFWFNLLYNTLMNLDVDKVATAISDFINGAIEQLQTEEFGKKFAEIVDKLWELFSQIIKKIDWGGLFKVLGNVLWELGPEGIVKLVGLVLITNFFKTWITQGLLAAISNGLIWKTLSSGLKKGGAAAGKWITGTALPAAGKWISGNLFAAGGNLVEAGGGTLGVGPSSSVLGTQLLGAGSLAGFVVGTVEAGKGLDEFAKGLKEHDEELAATGVARFGTVGAFTAGGAALGSVIPGVGTVVGAGLGALVGGITSIFTSEKIGKWWKETAHPALDKFFGESIPNTFKSAGEAVQGAWTKVKDGVTNAVNTAKETVVNKWNEIKTGVSEKVSALKETISNKWNEIKTNVTEKVSAVKEAISTKWNEIKTGVSEKVNSIKENISTRWNEIKTGLAEKVNTIKTNMSEKWEEIKGNIKEKVETIKTNITEKWEAIKTSVSDKVETLKTNLSTKWESIKTSASGKVEELKTSIIGKFNTLKTDVSSKVKTITGAIETMFGSIGDSIKGMWTKIKEKASGLWEGTKDTVGGWLDKLPHLASGGYVSANTPRLAVVGDNRREGEFVAPESKLKNAVTEAMIPLLNTMMQSSQGSGDITIPIILDGNMLDQVIVRASDRNALRTGGR